MEVGAEVLVSEVCIQLCMVQISQVENHRAGQSSCIGLLHLCISSFLHDLCKLCGRKAQLGRAGGVGVFLPPLTEVLSTDF